MRRKTHMRSIIAGLAITWLIAAGVLAIGWVMNIITMVHHASDPITTITVVRAIGIFVPPLGGVMGWF